jgi:serine/threonine-protein kinase
VTGSGSGQVNERIARHQHAAEVMRARSILAVAFALWLVVGLPIDVLLHDSLGSGSLAVLVGVRLASNAYQWLVLVLLFRRLPPRVANGLIASVFPVSGLAIALMALRMGGLASPYALVLCVGILVLVTAMPLPWKKGALLAGSTVAIYAGAMMVGASAQLSNVWARDMFLVFVMTLAAGAVCVAWAGHVLWTLRRSVFESRNLGRYRLIKRIGKGGMGEVWRAQDRALRREVALKILSPDYGRKPSAIARFEREIQATAEISHPNVVRIHDWGVSDDGVWYYAMDLLAGMDLATLVRQTGPLPAALVAHLGSGAAAGLAECHRRGIVHRDIKPGNLFVVAPANEPERLDVLDFGIARADTDSELTVAGAVLGTPGYMAPEVKAGAPGGVPADIYSLGAAFYYALTARSPHDTDGAPASALATVPAALDDLLVRMLDREPSRRPASVDEVVAALAACPPWTGHWPVDQTPVAPPSSEPTAPTTVAGRSAPTPATEGTASPTTVEG